MSPPGKGKDADGHPSDMNGARLLIVEDLREELQLLMTILEKAGYRTRGVQCGMDALAAAKNDPPDLIVLDIVLPDISGYDVCELLKKDEETCDIPVIFLSGMGALNDKVRALSLGAVDFVEKPFRMKEIQMRIKNHLNTRHLQRRLEAQNLRLLSEIRERRQAEAALEQYRMELEQRVSERTASLVKANADLQSEIAERKKLEEILKKSRAELTAIYDAAPIIMLLLDENRKIRKANRTVREMSGRSYREIIGCSCGFALRCFGTEETDIPCGGMPPCRDCRLSRIVRDTIRTGRMFHGEEVRLTVAAKAEAKEVWMLVSAIPLDISGTRNVLVCLEDITQRRELDDLLQKSHNELEMRVRKRTEDLRKSEERLELAITGANLGMWDWNIPDGRVRYSTRMRSLLGYAPEEIREHVSTWEHLLHPDDRHQSMRELEDNLAGNTPYFENEHRLKTKTGQWKWILAKGKVVEWDEEGKPIRHAGTYMDISIRKQAEIEQERAREAAESANRTKSRFLANMSHEIRTPMNAILGFTHLIRKTNPARRQRHYLERIRSASNSLLMLIDDILDFSKIEAGRLKIYRQPFDLHSILDNIGSMFRYQTDRKGISLNISVDREVPSVLFGDPARIEQVLVNLVGNALKFTEAGGIVVSVSSETGAGEDLRLTFSVKDTGIGIPKEKTADIFSPFTQVDDSSVRRYPGTGLGLAISRQLADLMGGEMTLESEPGTGSVFRFTIPLEKTDESPRPVASYTDSECFAAGEFPGSARVLVVEDHEINREMMRNILEGEGILVDTAGNGIEAVDAVIRTEYDAVLMDVQMSGMNGYEATKNIRALESERRGLSSPERIPIIAMTALAMQGDREKCLEAGMDDYIGKPVNPARLFAVLGKWILPGMKAEPEGGNAEIPLSDSGDSRRLLTDFFPEIDMDAALRRLKGNEALLLKLLGKLEKFTGIPDSVRSMLDAGSYEAAGSAVHALKGAAGNLSATELHGSALELENLIREIGPDEPADPAAVSAGIRHLQAALDAVLASVRRFRTSETGVFGTDEPEKAEPAFPEGKDFRLPLVALYKAAKMNRTEIRELFEALPPLQTDSETVMEMKTLEEQVDAYDFEGARLTIEGIAEALNLSLDSQPLPGTGVRG